MPPGARAAFAHSALCLFSSRRHRLLLPTPLMKSPRWVVSGCDTACGCRGTVAHGHRPVHMAPESHLSAGLPFCLVPPLPVRLRHYDLLILITVTKASIPKALLSTCPDCNTTSYNMQLFCEVHDHVIKHYLHLKLF